MATTIITKYGSGAPAASDVVRGELAVDTENKRLYTEDSGGSVVELGTNPAANVTFGDNVKAVFGAGSDLEIYHDGSNSIVADVGTGGLFLSGSSYVAILNGDRSEYMLNSNVNGEVALYYDGSKKLETTSTGIDVTGSVVSDGLTVQSASSPQDATISSTATNGAARLVLSNDAQTYRLLVNGTSSDRFQIFDGTATAARFAIDTNGDISFYEDTGTTAKFFWDASAESLGIGTTSPAYNLTIGDGTGSTEYISIESSTTGISGILFGDTTPARGGILYNNSDNSLAFRTATNTERMRIDSSGRVGIGTSSPAALLEAYGSGGVSDFDQAAVRAVRSVSSPPRVASYNLVKYRGSDSAILSGDSIGALRGLAYVGATGGEVEAARIEFDTEGTLTDATNGIGGFIAFETRTSGSSLAERMRIDSSGNLLVGKTGSALGTAGVEINQGGTAGKVWMTRSGDNPLLINRLSDDGSLVDFYKDGASVGNIGTNSSRLSIGNGDTGLLFAGDLNNITPFNTTGNASRDGAIDLGESATRFKDLYLSGGVYVGGTGAANYLDDYEEGTWTPAPNSGTLNTGATGSYVKIGNLVHIQGQLSFSANGTTNRINGLPFRPRIEATLNTVRQRFLVYGSTSNTAIYGYCQDVNNALFLQDEDRSVHNFDTADGVYTFAFTYET